MSSDPKQQFSMHSTHSASEDVAEAKMEKLYAQSPIPANEALANLGLFQNRQSISRFLYIHSLYEKIVPISGIIVEFGVRWGQNLSWFSSMRGIYEPYNLSRKVVGFDTFEGFTSVSPEDGSKAQLGDLGVTSGYEKYLDQVLQYHESNSPLSHMNKYELIKGDAGDAFERYLAEHPETIVALAYFDMDVYEPTKRCLELLQPHLTKGSCIGFDEMNHPLLPGETVAVREVLGLGKYSLQTSPLSPSSSYVIVD